MKKLAMLAQAAGPMTMRCIIICAGLALLVGCSPNPDQVGKSAQAALQKDMDKSDQLRSDHLRVEKVVAIHTTGSAFTGAATISGHGKEFQLPMDITADKENVIYTTKAGDWSSFADSVVNARGAVFLQAYSDVVLKPDVFDEFMPKLLKPDFSAFKQNLDVVTPVAAGDGYWFGSGCRAHECGIYEAAWAVDQKTGAGYAIIMGSDEEAMKKLEQSTGTSASTVDGSNATDYKTFHIYVDSGSLGDIPKPIVDWAQEHGATNLNTVIVHGAYGAN